MSPARHDARLPGQPQALVRQRQRAAAAVAEPLGEEAVERGQRGLDRPAVARGLGGPAQVLLQPVGHVAARPGARPG